MDTKPSYVVMGVSGCGKSTIGQLLASTLGVEFFDADDFHPEANVEKMTTGIPLTDEDRWPWLARISEEIRRHTRGCVFACSALKQSYRDIIARDNTVIFIFLDASYDEILRRMELREHFMPPSLLASQFETLEAPTNAVRVDASLSTGEIMAFLEGKL